MAHYLLFIICAFGAIFGFLDARPSNQQGSSNAGNSSLQLDRTVYAGKATYYDRM